MYSLYSRIEELCEAKGIKVGRMCADIGIRRSVMGNLSSGKSKTLSTKTLHLIASYFNVPIEFLLDLGEPDPRDIPPEPEISDRQLMFCLWGDEMDEFTPEDLEDIREFAYMKLLKKKEQKKKEGE